MVFVMDVILGGVRSSIGALKPHVSTIVTMNISSIFATSLLNKPSFRKQLFNLVFLGHQRKTPMLLE
jgi:hypothetical protein